MFYSAIDPCTTITLCILTSTILDHCSAFPKQFEQWKSVRYSSCKRPCFANKEHAYSYVTNLSVCYRSQAHVWHRQAHNNSSAGDWEQHMGSFYPSKNIKKLILFSVCFIPSQQDLPKIISDFCSQKWFNIWLISSDIAMHFMTFFELFTINWDTV